MDSKMRLSFFFLLCVFALNTFSQDTISYYWELNSLESIAGNTLTYTGTPEVVETDLGKAIKFDSKDSERILIDANPIGDATEFTVEVVFKADSGFENQTNDPRFVHIQDPDDSDEKRVMMEIRVNDDDKVYLDGFMKTDNDNLALIDERKIHAIGDWIHAAITFKDNTFKTYVNGVEELSGSLGYASKIINPTGKTSLGARMNEKNYYSGLMKCLRVTHAELNPAQFLNIDTMNIDYIPVDKPVVVPEPTTVSSSQKTDNLQVFPVPANEYFNLSFSKSEYVLNIQLTNISGIVVKSLPIMQKCNDKLVINVEDLNSGIYFLRVNSESGYSVKQVLISK